MRLVTKAVKPHATIKNPAEAGPYVGVLKVTQLLGGARHRGNFCRREVDPQLELDSWQDLEMSENERVARG